MRRTAIPSLLLSSVAIASGAAAQAKTTTLEALRDQKRVLLVFSNGDNRLSEQQLTVAADHASDFRERDLLLVGITGTNSTAPTATTLSGQEDRVARKRFHVEPGEFTVILLGKDGGEKLRAHAPISWQKLRSTIDAMPMRKEEMRR